MSHTVLCTLFQVSCTFEISKVARVVRIPVPVSGLNDSPVPVLLGGLCPQGTWEGGLKGLSTARPQGTWAQGTWGPERTPDSPQGTWGPERTESRQSSGYLGT